MARTHKAEEMTPAEFRQAMAERPIVILATGILEWHGDHLPLGTITFSKPLREVQGEDHVLGRA